jgi:hypothetical protein
MASPSVLITPSGQILGAGLSPLTGVPTTLLLANGAVTLSTPSVVPLQPLPAQLLRVSLGGQATTIKVYFKQITVPLAAQIPTVPPPYGAITPCFLDLYVNDALVIGGVLCQHENLIVRDSYLGFIGDLSMIDTQGSEDPQVAGLGSRWILSYWPDL